MSRRPLPRRVPSSPDGGFDELVAGSGAGLIVHTEMTNAQIAFDFDNYAPTAGSYWSPSSQEASARCNEQAAIRYGWAREGLASARVAVERGDFEGACASLVHAELMRDSGRSWRTQTTNK